MTASDPVPTRDHVKRANEALVTRLIEPLHEPGPSGTAMVQRLEADDADAAVHFDLVTAAGTVRVQVANRDTTQPALVHTRSLSVVFQSDDGRQLAPALQLSLQSLGQLLDRRDPGGLSLVHPGGRRTARHPLLVYAAHETRPHAWSREKFEGEIAKIVTSGAGPFDALIAVVAQPCEMQCAFCPSVDRDKAHDDWVDKGDRAQLDDLLYQLDRTRVLGVNAVDLGGNDVLRFALIEELLAGVAALGYSRIIVQTTGLPLANRAFAEAIAAGPATELCIPIYGATAAVHESITRTPGSFDRLCRAIDNARELGKQLIRLHTIALGSTLGTLEELIAFCQERFGLNLRVSPLRPNWVAEREHLADAPRFSDLKPIIARQASHFSEEFPICQFPADVVRENFGRAAPVRSPRHRVNLFDLGMSGREHERVEFERKRHHAAPCQECVLRDACGGALGSYLEQYGASELVPFAAADVT